MRRRPLSQELVDEKERAVRISAAVVRSLSCVRPFATPWTAARQASLSFTVSQSLLKLTHTESVMPSNHLIFCSPLLLPSIFPSFRDFFRVCSLHQVAKVLELQLWLSLCEHPREHQRLQFAGGFLSSLFSWTEVINWPFAVIAPHGSLAGG